MLPWSDILGAVKGFPIIRTFWPVVAAIRDRTRLKVDVVWEWDEGDGSAPQVVVRNVGGSVVYLDSIALVEAGDFRHGVGGFHNHEVKPGQNFYHRPDWTYPPDEPEFRVGWQGLRVCVTDALGREWWSKSPTTKPSWFSISPPSSWDVMPQHHGGL